MSMLILKTLLFSSVTAIILSTLLLLFQRLGRVKLSARIAKWAWVACLLTLFLPLYFLTNVNSLTTVVQNSPVRSFQYGDGVETILNQNVAGYFNQPDPVNPNSVIQGNDLGEKSLPQENNLPASGTATSQGATGSALDFFKTLSMKEIGLSLWLMGILFMGSKFTWRYQKARKLLLENSQLLDSESLPEFVRKYPVRIASIHSPMVFGIVRPTIFLPRVIKEKDALYYALLHEYTHIKNRDLLLKFIAEMAVVIHWFNPLVRMIRQRISIASEDACDEKLSLGMNEDQRKSYAWAILSFMDTTIPENTLTSGVMSMSNSTIPVKARLLRILKCQKMERPMWVIAALVVLLSLTASLLIACGVTVPGKDSASTSEISESSATQETTVPTTENKTEVPESQPSENLVAKSDAEMAKRLPEGVATVTDNRLGTDIRKDSFLFTYNEDTEKLLAYGHYDKAAYPPTDLSTGALKDGSMNYRTLTDSVPREIVYYYDNSRDIWRISPAGEVIKEPGDFSPKAQEFQIYFDSEETLKNANNLPRLQNGNDPQYIHYYMNLFYTEDIYLKNGLEVDMNGDGIKEVIEVIPDGPHFKIDVNGAETLQVDHEYWGGFRIIDIDNNDSYLEVIVEFDVPQPWHTLSYLFRYDGSKFYNYTTHDKIFVLENNKVQLVNMSGNSFLDMGYIEDFEVDKTLTFKAISSLFTIDREVTALKDFTVTFIEGGTSKEGQVKAGETLTFTKTNFKDEIYFKTKDQREGILKIYDYQYVGTEKIPAQEALDGLVYGG